jgi:hypothetical protein
LRRFFIGFEPLSNLTNPLVVAPGGGHGWPERPLSPDGELAVKPGAETRGEFSWTGENTEKSEQMVIPAAAIRLTKH